MATAVVINMHARQGKASLERQVRRYLPGAKVAVTRSLAEAEAFVTQLGEGPAPELLLSGGGDGTAVSLLNAFERRGAPMPTLGLLPLGTGNGWARVTGSPPFGKAMQRLAARREAALPTRTFGLVEVEGVLSPWAGTGWDAEIVGDYQAMMKALPRRGARLFGGFPGYMVSLFGKTVPRMAVRARTNVRLINKGSAALVVDPAGKVVRVPDGEAGAVLYEGPVSVCGSGTTTDLGLGFRAFPFANLRADRMETRVYSESTLKAASKVHRLWKGAHPLPNDVHFLLDACRMEFDRPVPVEIGGDVIGHRESIEYSLSARTATLLDWTRLS